MEYQWHEARLALGGERRLTIPALTLLAGQQWCFVGSNGSGKTALARALCGELPLCQGRAPVITGALRLSFESQQQLMAAEWQRRNTDMVGEEEEAGYLVSTLLLEQGDEAEARHWSRRFGVEALWSRPLRFLSSGEGRKVLLARALLAHPTRLVLDEPFDGLDQDSRRDLAALIGELAEAGLALVLIVNRFDEIPTGATHLGLLSDGCLLLAGARAEVEGSAEVRQLMALNRTAPPLPPPYEPPPSLPPGPLVQMRQIRVAYGAQVIIDGLDWTLLPGQHWQITGPNGAGKSTLLALITGDHPQGYSNDLTLFGVRRGSGESIWQIKRHIGLVSPALHLDYRVACSARTVILSGFHDSIGLYVTPGDRQWALAEQWLNLLGLAGQGEQPFHALSFGQQRLLLIARALVKQPPLLILDEPLQGLDPLNRHLVREVLARLIATGRSQVLFVSHHPEDAPAGLTHRLCFVPDAVGGYHYHQGALG